MQTQLESRAVTSRGFTLVELLVVVTVIAVVAALLLPGVQYSRESMRRFACVNKLRQIAIGIANYESVHRSYPLAVGGNGSFLVTILGFVENQALEEKIERFWNEGGRMSGFNFACPLYHCPSDPGPQLLGFGAATNYNGSSGSWLVEANGYDGIFQPSFGNKKPGIVRIKDVTHGLSATSCVAEVIHANGSPDRMRTAWNTPTGRNINRRAFSDLCRSIPQNAITFGWQGDLGMKGVPWAHGGNMFTLFNHVCCPNSPSCLNEGGLADGAASVSSFHGVFCNLAFADGHIASVDSAIDPDVWFSFGSCYDSP